MSVDNLTALKQVAMLINQKGDEKALNLLMPYLEEAFGDNYSGAYYFYTLLEMAAPAKV